jgi:hypothetical protein
VRLIHDRFTDLDDPEFFEDLDWIEAESILNVGPSDPL